MKSIQHLAENRIYVPIALLLFFRVKAFNLQCNIVVLLQLLNIGIYLVLVILKRNKTYKSTAEFKLVFARHFFAYVTLFSVCLFSCVWFSFK